MTSKILFVPVLLALAFQARAEEKIIATCQSHERRVDVIDLGAVKEFRYYYSNEFVAHNGNVQTETDDDGGVTYTELGDRLRIKEGTGVYAGVWPHPPKILQILMDCSGSEEF